MFKRLRWLLPVTAGGGFVLWLALGGIEPGKNRTGTGSNPENADRPATSISKRGGESVDPKTARESPRHNTGELERYQAEETRLARLKKAVTDQEEKVEERRKVLATIVRTKGIIYKGGDPFYGESGGHQDTQAKAALESYNQLDQIRMQLGSQIARLLKYENEQLMVYAAGLDLPDNTVKLLYPEYQEAKRELSALKANGRGENDPAVRTQSGQIVDLKRRIDDATVKLRAMLQAQWEMANDRLKNLEVATREKQIKSDPDSQDYLDAKRDFETDQKLLQEMKLKLVTAQMEAKDARK